ncbi:MAG: hypothetical protein C4293_15335 [Nitrospiraceae bacterium]
MPATRRRAAGVRTADNKMCEAGVQVAMHDVPRIGEVEDAHSRKTCERWWWGKASRAGEGRPLRKTRKKKCCEKRCEMNGENGGIEGKQEESDGSHFSCIDAELIGISVVSMKA